MVVRSKHGAVYWIAHSLLSRGTAQSTIAMKWRRVAFVAEYFSSGALSAMRHRCGHVTISRLRHDNKCSTRRAAWHLRTSRGVFLLAVNKTSSFSDRRATGHIYPSMDANLNALALKSSSLLDERAEFVSLLKMQQMVGVACLEVLQGAPSQVEAYRKEVNELTNLVKGYLDEVREMRANGNKPEPSSPSTASIRSVSVPDSPGPLTLLDASFEEAPETQWYEHKPLPRFSVRVPGAADGEVVLSVSLLNGRGLAEEQKANGTGELIAGDRTAVVRGGVAEWANLRICEPSSKHYGAFTMIISAIRSPDGLGVEELRSQPLTVQVGRMWSKRRKAETDLGPEDPITQIPGVGARYVQRLQLHGISTIGQFSAMAATAHGRDSLCKLCKGDNPRNSLNQQKLQAMIDAADKVCSVFDAHGNVKRARGGNALADGLSVMTTASALSGSSPLPEGEPSFSMEELMLLASPDTVDFSPGTPKLGPLVADGAPNGFASFALAENDDDDEIEPRMRRMHVSAVNDAAAYDDTASAISILPPKQMMTQGNGQRDHRHPAAEEAGYRGQQWPLWLCGARRAR